MCNRYRFLQQSRDEFIQMVQDKSKLSDPADVAADGYEALMNGDDYVISGMKNKMMVGMSNVTPDSKVADIIKKQQEPAKK